MGSRVGDARRRRSRRWRLAGRASTVRPGSPTPRRHDQPGCRRVHAARQRQGDPGSPLSVHAVLRRLGLAHSDQGRQHAHRLGRGRRHGAESHTGPDLHRLSRAHRSFTAAPLADSTGDPKFVVPPAFVTSGSPFTATFTATIRTSRGRTPATAFTAGQITFSTRPGTNTAITAAFAVLPTRSPSSSSPWEMRRRRTRASGRRRRSRRSRTA